MKKKKKKSGRHKCSPITIEIFVHEVKNKLVVCKGHTVGVMATIVNLAISKNIDNFILRDSRGNKIRLDDEKRIVESKTLMLSEVYHNHDGDGECEILVEKMPVSLKKVKLGISK